MKIPATLAVLYFNKTVIIYFNNVVVIYPDKTAVIYPDEAANLSELKTSGEFNFRIPRFLSGLVGLRGRWLIN